MFLFQGLFLCHLAYLRETTTPSDDNIYDEQ